ncbi:MAG: hypothetical protein WD023_06260 [Ilumatobacteraceae bacterium]
MFTTGSKLFIGATTVALAGAIVFGLFMGGDAGRTATVGLVSCAVALAFLTGINFYVRDSNVGALQSDAAVSSSAAVPAPGSSMWPAIGAVGAGLLVLGLVTAPIVFKAGVVVVLAAVVEWMVQGWSERASGDPAYNAAVRQRILNPLEFPVLAGVGLSVIIYSFSRIMLFLSKEAGPAVFAILAALLLAAGFLFASRASLKKSIVVGISTIAALGLVSTGAVMAVDGEREIKTYKIIETDPAVCLSNDETKIDYNASQSLAAKSNVAATIVYQDGQLYAQVIGIAEPQRTITLPNGNPSNIVFRNLGDETVRLTANLGAFEQDINGTKVIEKPVTCTTLVEPDGRQFLSLRYTKSSSWTQEPYTLVVPGVEGASVEVVVP